MGARHLYRMDPDLDCWPCLGVWACLLLWDNWRYLMGRLQATLAVNVTGTVSLACRVVIPAGREKGPAGGHGGERDREGLLCMWRRRPRR